MPKLLHRRRIWIQLSVRRSGFTVVGDEQSAAPATRFFNNLQDPAPASMEDFGRPRAFGGGSRYIVAGNLILTVRDCWTAYLLPPLLAVRSCAKRPKSI